MRKLSKIGFLILVAAVSLSACGVEKITQNRNPTEQPQETPTTAPSATASRYLKPVDAFRAVLNALSNGDINEAKSLTCKDMRDMYDVAQWPPSLDYTNAKLEEMLNDGYTAVISVTGSVKVSGDTSRLELAVKVIKQNDGWIFCDDFFKPQASATLPTESGVYLSLDRDFVKLLEFEEWPDDLDAMKQGKVIFMGDFPQPRIRINMRGWTVKDITLKSDSGSSIDIEVIQSDPDGQFFEIQPANKLERGQYCITRSNNSSDKRHWCFNNIEVIEVPEIQGRQG